MEKSSKIINWIIAAIIIISFGIGVYYYGQMPDRMASHWGANGEVNGYMSKFWGLFLMPIVSIILFLLFLAIPIMDPLKENIKKFRSYYDKFILLVMIFLFYIYFVTILWNLEIRLDVSLLIIPGLAILFYYAGVLIGHSKRNWTIGIRTPWTISSDAVWGKIHSLGAKLFKICAIAMLIGLIVPDYISILLIGDIAVLAIGASLLAVYSYVLFKKEEKGSKSKHRK